MQDSQACPEVKISKNKGVMTVTLSRPAKKNALNQAMYEALIKACHEVDEDETLHCLYLNAQGADFCAGNDIMDFVTQLSAHKDMAHMPVFRFLKALCFFKKPLIVAVQGRAIGIGTTLLLQADHVVAAQGCQLSVPFVKLGLVPEAGSSLLLRQRIGHARAFEWISTGRAMLSDEALHLGLVNQVCPEEVLYDIGLNKAHYLTTLSSKSLMATKALMRDNEALWAHIQAEAEIFFELLKSPEAMSAFQSFLQPKS